MGGLSVTHPVLAVGFALGVLAIAGLPPFGVFASEFMLVSSTFARQPLLAVALVFGLLISFGAIVLRLQDVVFGKPKGPSGPVQASYVPLFIHLALVLIAGLWLPEPIARWFRVVAQQLG
jgi:hydrogenase-4 component F